MNRLCLSQNDLWKRIFIEVELRIKYGSRVHSNEGKVQLSDIFFRQQLNSNKMSALCYEG